MRVKVRKRSESLKADRSLTDIEMYTTLYSGEGIFGSERD